MTTLRLPVRGPFSLAASTRFLEGFAPARYRGSAFPTVAAADPVVAGLAERYPGLRPVCFFSPCEAACWAVLSQRSSMVGAAAVKKRIAQRFGQACVVDGVRLWAFPAPDRLRAVAIELPVPEVKRGRLRALAEAARRAAGRRSPAIPPGRRGPGRGSGAPRHGGVLRGAGGGARGRCSGRLSGEGGAPACRDGRALRARRSVRPGARRRRRGMGALPELGLVAHPCRPRRPGRGGGGPSQAVGL